MQKIQNLKEKLKGTIYEYRYNRILGDFDDTIRYDIANHQCIAEDPLDIELRYNTSFYTYQPPDKEE